MIVRIEDAGLTRGREFKLFAYSTSAPFCEIYGYDSLANRIISIPHNMTKNGNFYIFRATAPSIDGYLLAKVGNQKVIKRIGNPLFRAFVYGYRPGYSVPYRYFDISANVIDICTILRDLRIRFTG